MEKELVNKQEEKIIYLIAKGIVKLYESDEKNFAKLNRELKRAINILAAQNEIIIMDRSHMISTFSEKIGEWYNADSIYREEKFIEDGIPTDFCYEMAMDTSDIEAELEQRVILEVKNEFKAYGQEKDYEKFRSYLIKNPISTREKLDEFILKNAKYKSKLKKIYARIYEFYEDIPEHYIINNNIEVCNYCGWTIINKNKDKHCISDYCKANLGIEKSKVKPHSENMIRVKRGVMRYTALPGIPEIDLKNKIEKLGLEVKLYPNFDEYDLEVIFNDCSWAIDVKDYGNPYNLVRKVTEFPPNSCEKSFIVVPNKRYSLNKDYKYIINSEEPIDFEYIIERDLIKLIKEKINNEKL